MGELIESRVFGRAVIGKGSSTENSTIKEPYIIGHNCRITISYIGSYTAINDGCTIENTEIEDSLIMDGCSILSVSRIIEQELERMSGSRRTESCREATGSWLGIIQI